SRESAPTGACQGRHFAKSQTAAHRQDVEKPFFQILPAILVFYTTCMEEQHHNFGVDTIRVFFHYEFAHAFKGHIRIPMYLVVPESEVAEALDAPEETPELVISHRSIGQWQVAVGQRNIERIINFGNGRY